MSSGLTPRMAACLAAIRKLTVDGVPPDYRELAAEIGLKSPSGVARIVQRLAERGYVTHSGRARSIRIIARPRREELARLSSEDLWGVLCDADDILLKRATGEEARP